MPEDNVIIFPADKIKNLDKVADSNYSRVKEAMQQKKQEHMEYVEGLVDDIALDILRRCVGAQCNTNSPTFIRDFSLLVDTMRSMLKRDFGLNHIIQRITDKIVHIETNEQGQQVARIDYGQIYDLEKKETVQANAEPEMEQYIEFIPDEPFEPDNDN